MRIFEFIKNLEEYLMNKGIKTVKTESEYAFTEYKIDFYATNTLLSKNVELVSVNFCYDPEKESYLSSYLELSFDPDMSKDMILDKFLNLSVGDFYTKLTEYLESSKSLKCFIENLYV